MNLTEIWLKIVDGIHPTDGRVQWRFLVNTEMNLRAQQNLGEFLDQLMEF
jgi:hypothetical protein